MTEYNCYDYAIELGFTEEEAQALQSSKCGKGQDATVLRRLAKIKNLPGTRPAYPEPLLDLPSDAPQSITSPTKPSANSSKPVAKRKSRAKRAITKGG